MNWPNLALTKAQQAPDQPSGWMPPCATVAQTVRSRPVHWALMKAQLITCGRIMATSAMPMMVRMVSPVEAIRFLRTQPPRPRSLGGAGSASAISARTKERSCSCMTLPLHQRHPGVDHIHDRRGHQAECKIDGHHDHHALD